ncbi:hypothetical protein LIA77_11379 [Sarocladium implicatum]|nr:hypothetical protein LIA77_11379 [Sarocladium implicatum]
MPDPIASARIRTVLLFPCSARSCLRLSAPAQQDKSPFVPRSECFPWLHQRSSRAVEKDLDLRPDLRPENPGRLATCNPRCRIAKDQPGSAASLMIDLKGCLTKYTRSFRTSSRSLSPKGDVLNVDVQLKLYKRKVKSATHGKPQMCWQTLQRKLNCSRLGSNCEKTYSSIFDSR